MKIMMFRLSVGSFRSQRLLKARGLPFWSKIGSSATSFNSTVLGKRYCCSVLISSCDSVSSNVDELAILMESMVAWCPNHLDR